jgi:plastocyanin
MSQSPEKRANPALPVILGIGALAVLAVIVLIAVLASGSGDAKPEQTPAVLEGTEVTIDISDFDYSPRDATISAGTTVTWVNSDSAPHDAHESNGDDPWKTELLDEGESGSVTFNDAGYWEYNCTVHSDMKGTLTVND